MKSGILTLRKYLMLVVSLSSSASAQFSGDGSWGTFLQGQSYVVTPGGFKDPPGHGESAAVVVDPFRFIITGSSGEDVNVVLTLPDSFDSDFGASFIPLRNWTYSFCNDGYGFQCSGALYSDTISVPVLGNGMTLLSLGATLPVPMTASPGSYTAALRASFAGKETTAYRTLETVLALDVDDRRSVPLNFDLQQNYPNPCNPTTTIRYDIVDETMVSLKVYDMFGQEVSSLVEGIRPPGLHDVVFDGSNMSSGIYFYKLQAGTSSAVKRLVLLR